VQGHRSASAALMSRRFRRDSARTPKAAGRAPELGVVRWGGGSAEERKREQGGLRFQGALRSWASCVGGGGSAEERRESGAGRGSEAGAICCWRSD